jgi:predicted CopG family antitoxin
VKTIKIDQDVYNYLISKAATVGESPSLILRRELHLLQPTETIEIDDDTYNFLVSKTANFGETASNILRRELNLDNGPQPDPAGMIVFHILAGTGTQPWNTQESAIVATIGDTLRVVNGDSIPHRLHTNGNPFQHPITDIPPGQSADFVLQTPFDSSALSQPLYDHNAGPNAQFWINVRLRP